MKDKLNIVIVGGGSTWCPGILKALTKHMDILPLNRVMLYDIDAERQGGRDEAAQRKEELLRINVQREGRQATCACERDRHHWQP